jgi:hypothetical protein
MKSVLPASLLCLALCGAGCLPDITSPHVAATLVPDVSVQPIPLQRGFGTLPTIRVPQSQVTVKLEKPLPTIPQAVTVLRIRPGTPNPTQLLNVIAALGLPGGTVGNDTAARSLDMSWQDANGAAWSYAGDTRTLTLQTAQDGSGSLTTSQLPSNDFLLSVANSHLTSWNIPIQNYLDGAVTPDWNYWWTNEQENSHCMNTDAVQAIRTISLSNDFAGFPVLQNASSTNCVAPEFPTRAVVHFGSVADGQNIINPDGTSVDGITLTLDTTRKTVLSGTVVLTSDPDRSDYPTLTATQVTNALMAGGLSGATGNITITDYATELLRVEDTKTNPHTIYLIPSLVAKGTRTKNDGTTSPFQIVVPLPAS